MMRWEQPSPAAGAAPGSSPAGPGWAPPVTFATAGMPGFAPTAPQRHPLDPDPAPSTKATAVMALGFVAVVAAPVVAGLIPAAVALLLARTAEAELRAAGGFLTGGRRLRLGVRLALAAVVIAIVAIGAAAVLALIRYGGSAGDVDFAPTVD